MRGRIDIRQATGRICHRASSHFQVFYVVDNRFEKANMKPKEAESRGMQPNLGAKGGVLEGVAF